MFRKIALTAGIVLVMTFAFSCSGDNGDNNPAPVPAISSSGGSSLLGNSSSSGNSSFSGGSSSPGGSSSSSSNLSGSSSSGSSSSGNSSSSGGAGGGFTGTRGTFVDDRDSKSYKWVKIGEQFWMAENLNYAVEGGKCYGENDIEGVYDEDGLVIAFVPKYSPEEIQAYCTTYGKLYNWTTAMSIEAKYYYEIWGGSDVKHRGICPTGWHIPSSADWNILMKFVNPNCSGNMGCESAGIKLKAKSGWDWSELSESGNGTDDFEFAALPGGKGLGDNYENVGKIGYWWSASEADYASGADIRIMYYYFEYVRYSDGGKESLYSVRCLKD